MKKLIAALVLSLSTAALAQEEQSQDPNSQAQQEQKRNEGRRIRTGVDASEVGPGIRDAAGIDTAKEGTFSKKGQAFNLKGTFKGAAFDGITIARQGLPDADLDVRKQTEVKLDGKKVEVGAIPEGAQVRARFQLEGEEIVALEINATSPKGASKKAPRTGMKDNPNQPRGTQDTQPVPQE